MRFRLGSPPTDDEVPEDSRTWHLVNEPNQSVQFATAVCMTLLVVLCIALTAAWSVGITRLLDMSSYIEVLTIIAVIPFHELLHATGFKGGIGSKQTVFGFNPKTLGFYAHYCGEISRTRFIVIAALPLLILTVVPLAIVASSTPDSNRLIYLALANGFLSGMDVLAIIIVLKQVPQQAVIVNTGMKSYWASVQP